MIEPTAVDREQMRDILRHTLWRTAEQAVEDKERLAAALAAAREEGRNEVRAKVEALADEIELTTWLDKSERFWTARHLRAAVTPAQPEDDR